MSRSKSADPDEIIIEIFSFLDDFCTVKITKLMKDQKLMKEVYNEGKTL